MLDKKPNHFNFIFQFLKPGVSQASIAITGTEPPSLLDRPERMTLNISGLFGLRIAKCDCSLLSRHPESTSGESDSHEETEEGWISR